MCQMSSISKTCLMSTMSHMSENYEGEIGLTVGGGKVGGGQAGDAGKARKARHGKAGQGGQGGEKERSQINSLLTFSTLTCATPD